MHRFFQPLPTMPLLADVCEAESVTVLERKIAAFREQTEGLATCVRVAYQALRKADDDDALAAVRALRQTLCAREDYCPPAVRV